MTGEFKVDLREYDQDNVAASFAKEYPDMLALAYSKSSYGDGDTYPQTAFCAGAFAGSKLLLICKMQADMLICNVETLGDPDLAAMKKAINLYYGQVTKILHKNGLKWSKPLSTINLESYRPEGVIRTLRARLRAVFAERWEKLILAPVASMAASYLAIQFHILDAGEALTDVKKAVTLTFEAYIGLIVVLFLTVLFKANKKEFTFNI